MLIHEILQALELFALGMGTVFALLSLLIFSIWTMSLICMNGKTNLNESPLRDNEHTNTSNIGAAIVAAIAATKHYRARKSLSN